jgi:hypothetical protein
MTLPEFTPVFALLATQLRATDADEITIRSYFESMKDLEIELVAMAADRLARTAEWFPKTSEWREAVARVEHSRIEAQRAVLRNLKEPLCAACLDTGWALTDNARAKRCDCMRLRRMEILGRQPFPQLPEAS